MYNDSLPVVSVSGDAYDCGLQHGSQAKDLIQKNIAYYIYLWKTYSNIDKDVVLSQARKFIPIIEGYDPDVMDEIRGIADGASASLEEVIALNARYEFVWAKMVVTRMECTSIAIEPEANLLRHTLLGQNWDFKPKLAKQCIILKIAQKGKPRIVTHVEAGTVAKIGFNSSGIGLCINALVSSKDTFEPKVPVLVICRGILNAQTLGDAIKAVVSADRAVSCNFLIAHKEGEIIDLEVTPDDVGFMYPEHGIIVHTNHFINLRTRNVIDKFISIIPDTLLRVERAKRLLLRKLGKIDIETFKEILRDHYNWPNSICRHEDPRLHPDLQLKTLASIIMDLNDGSMRVSNGPPCEEEYSKVEIEVSSKVQ